MPWFGSNRGRGGGGGSSGSDDVAATVICDRSLAPNDQIDPNTTGTRKIGIDNQHYHSHSHIHRHSYGQNQTRDRDRNTVMVMDRHRESSARLGLGNLVANVVHRVVRQMGFQLRAPLRTVRRHVKAWVPPVYASPDKDGAGGSSGGGVGTSSGSASGSASGVDGPSSNNGGNSNISITGGGGSGNGVGEPGGGSLSAKDGAGGVGGGVAGSTTATGKDKDGTASGKNMIVTRFPPAERIVAVGDIHGDVNALRRTLRIANLIDGKDQWVGGSTVLVQVGDILDRWNKERDVLNLLYRLQDEAPDTGGAVHLLFGNHEMMNVEADFRFVTEGGFADFTRPDKDLAIGKVDPTTQKPKGFYSGTVIEDKATPGKFNSVVYENMAKNIPAFMRSRFHAWKPGGPAALVLAKRTRVAVVIGDNVFVHGGLRPMHLQSKTALEDLNEGLYKWLLGKAEKPLGLRGGTSPVWMRDYSNPKPSSAQCRMLTDALAKIPAVRMIVGHTPQGTGINAACGAKVWRTDTGMSAAYGGPPEALEITYKNIRILTGRGAVKQYNRQTRAY